IDHRRCQNLVTWFKRYTAKLPIDLDGEAAKSWRGGDVIFFVRSKGDFPWHVAIVSDQKDGRGVPMVIDSFPPETSETHAVDSFGPIHSHFRMPDEGPTFQKP